MPAPAVCRREYVDASVHCAVCMCGRIIVAEYVSVHVAMRTKRKRNRPINLRRGAFFARHAPTSSRAAGALATSLLCACLMHFFHVVRPSSMVHFWYFFRTFSIRFKLRQVANALLHNIENIRAFGVFRRSCRNYFCASIFASWSVGFFERAFARRPCSAPYYWRAKAGMFALGCVRLSFSRRFHPPAVQTIPGLIWGVAWQSGGSGARTGGK